VLLLCVGGGEESVGGREGKEARRMCVCDGPSRVTQKGDQCFDIFVCKKEEEEMCKG
jgi:hypothetical protein